jgi:ribonuclease G
MAKEICISSTPHETRLAILEDDQLAEIYYERENEYTLAGSIYNGRVTRVLPGMQSAFVDLGLERDAFLYVTDFLEMEDPEESDEVEKAAAGGGNQPVREIRHANVQAAAPRPEQKSEPRSQEPRQQRAEQPRPDQDRNGRDRRPQQNAGLEIERVEPTAAPVVSAAPTQNGDADEAAGPGAKRWRGRRRRRGGRGAAEPVADPVETEASAETYLDSTLETQTPEIEVAPEIHASSAPDRSSDRFSQRDRSRGDRPGRGERQERQESRSDRSERAPEAFVLPGESLSKYGAEPAPEAAGTAPAASAAARPSSTYKPATLIETPLAWDGSGLLPGESISRHRNRGQETAVESSSSVVDGEPQGTFSDATTAQQHYVVEETEEFAEESEYAPAAADLSEDQFETSETVTDADDFTTEEVVEEEQPEEQLLPAAAVAEPAAAETTSDPFATDPFFATPVAEPAVEAPVSEQQAAEEPVGELRQDETQEGTDQENRSASHNIDPAPPSGFRLFGLGGKKKKDEPPPPPEYPTAVPLPASLGTVSAYAPGAGLVEEEVIEGEEFDAPRHHSKGDEHDLDEYEEEEKLHTQIRSGELGEMLQEAHLDHRIQLNFDDKNGDADGEDAFDIDEEDEEAEGQPTAEGAPADAGQRRERGGRGRRGGKPQGGQQGNRRGGPSRRSAQTSDLPIISDLLKPGQEILVQIAKEPIAKKGARITSHIALPGRFLVFMPTVTHVGVSRKISSDEERQRLKRILTSERGDAPGGFIVRTAAEGASEEELRADLRFLIHLWDEIKQRSESSKSPALIYHDLSLIERILRDQVSANFSSIWVDSEADYERIVRFLNRFSPNLVRRVKLYTKEVPLFEHFGIQDEISKALRSKVWLKSGGSIVINQTEALVAIDINTGKYVGKTARLEDTIVKTNLDAIPEIVRQIRLRDLGGIIIIDFIDMDERKNRFKVMAALEEALKNDRAPTKVLQFNDFGLVAITRKRVKQSLERTLSVPCPTCQATGMVKSSATVCNEIYTELRKMRKHFENADIVLRVNPETVKTLKANNERWLTEFEELVGKNILVKSDAALHPEQFDIQG